MAYLKIVHVLKAFEKLNHYYHCLNFAKSFCAALIKTYHLVLCLVHASTQEVIKILTLY